MITGTVPFRAQNMQELELVVSRGKFDFPEMSPRDYQPYTGQVKALIRGMLQVDVE